MLRVWYLALLLLAACNLQVGEPTAIPTPDLPQISFQEPANNARIREGEELTIVLVAEDSGAGIVRVELLIDDLPHSEAQPQVGGPVPVFTATMNWQAQGIGFHSLTAIAYRPEGMASRPLTINVVVTPADGS
jgi:hypothetical protein